MSCVPVAYSNYGTNVKTCDLKTLKYSVFFSLLFQPPKPAAVAAAVSVEQGLRTF